MQITSGTAPLASQGYSILLPADSGNTYNLIGISDAQGSSGTYAYSSTIISSARLELDDMTDDFSNRINLNFTDSGQGSFELASITPAGYSQSGDFTLVAGTAPDTIAGKHFDCTIQAGLNPFARSSTFSLDIAFSGETYTITGGPGVLDSTGTCSYSITNRSTAAIQVSDTVTGVSTTYMSFTGPASGFFAIAQPETGAYQVGTFTVSDRWSTFFNDATSLGDSWYSLTGADHEFGQFSMALYPYVYHVDMGWEYVVDGDDGANGAYFYDFTDGAWVYSQPEIFPFLYDFKRDAWLWYQPADGTADHYTSNPRKFYDFTTQTWVTHL